MHTPRHLRVLLPWVGRGRGRIIGGNWDGDCWVLQRQREKLIKSNIINGRLQGTRIRKKHDRDPTAAQMARLREKERLDLHVNLAQASSSWHSKFLPKNLFRSCCTVSACHLRDRVPATADDIQRPPNMEFYRSLLTYDHTDDVCWTKRGA